MRINFISQTKNNEEKNFWDILRDKLKLKSSLMKMASKATDAPREIVKEGLVISYKPNGEYIIKLGHKADVVVTGVAKQEKDLQQHIKNALSYLKSISPKVAAELQKIEAGKRDILVYKDIDRCRDCVFYESDTSHETYRDKCKNCVHATLGGTINNFFPRSQQLVMSAPQWEQVGDVEPKTAFSGTMSLLDAHKKGMANERHPEAIVNEVLGSVKEKNAVNLGTAVFKYFETNKLNFQRYAKPVIESIEKQAGIQIHLRKGNNVILAFAEEVKTDKFLCPQCGSDNIQRAKDYRMNQCLSCYRAFDNESAKTKSVEKQIEAKKKEKDIPGALSKCDQEKLDKYEEAKDNVIKSKELMPKGSVFDGTLCLAESEDEKKKTYKIIKFFRDEGRKQQVMERGLSLDDAKRYCSRPDTKVEGKWFCGFTEE
jgi:predicted RNA-binding Zn-ribbon protein involved in translation (DUF1610 family)